MRVESTAFQTAADRPGAAAGQARQFGSGPSVCMINFNGEAHLDRSLSALMDQAANLAEIVLIDNGSTDGSLGLVRERFPAVRVVSMPGNLGAAAARNAALTHARHDLVLLIDNDVALTPGSLDLLLAAVQRDQRVVAVMPAIIYGGGSTVQYDGAETHFLGQQSLQHENVPYESLPRSERTLGSLISACLLVDRSRLPDGAPGNDRLAAFDEDFFIYFEDHDFGFRMRAMGLDVRAVPQAFCYHGVGTPGISIRALGKYSPLRIVCHIRNRWLFILKNYSARSLILLAPVLLLYELVQFAAIVKKGWLRQWIGAAGWVVAHPGNWYRKRRRVQRGRRVSDGELLRGGPVPLRDEAVASPLERAAKRALDQVTGAWWLLVRGLL